MEIISLTMVMALLTLGTIHIYNEATPLYCGAIPLTLRVTSLTLGIASLTLEMISTYMEATSLYCGVVSLTLETSSIYNRAAPLYCGAISLTLRMERWDSRHRTHAIGNRAGRRQRSQNGARGKRCDMALSPTG